MLCYYVSSLLFKVKEKLTHFNMALIIIVSLNVLLQQVFSADRISLQLLSKEVLEHLFTYLTLVH